MLLRRATPAAPCTEQTGRRRPGEARANIVHTGFAGSPLTWPSGLASHGAPARRCLARPKRAQETNKRPANDKQIAGRLHRRLSAGSRRARSVRHLLAHRAGQTRTAGRAALSTPRRLSLSFSLSPGLFPGCWGQRAEHTDLSEVRLSEELAAEDLRWTRDPGTLQTGGLGPKWRRAGLE